MVLLHDPASMACNHSKVLGAGSWLVSLELRYIHLKWYHILKLICTAKGQDSRKAATTMHIGHPAPPLLVWCAFHRMEEVKMCLKNENLGESTVKQAQEIWTRVTCLSDSKAVVRLKCCFDFPWGRPSTNVNSWENSIQGQSLRHCIKYFGTSEIKRTMLLCYRVTSISNVQQNKRIKEDSNFLKQLK